MGSYAVKIVLSNSFVKLNTEKMLFVFPLTRQDLIQGHFIVGVEGEGGCTLAKTYVLVHCWS